MPDTKFAISVQYEGGTDKDRPASTSIYAFDAKGNLLASAPLVKDSATLSLPADSTTQAVRLFFGPPLEQDARPSLALLQRFGAYEDRRLLDPKNPKFQLIIPGVIWRRWPICVCAVRGRVIKRQPQPNGTVKDLPICNSRVTICEVDILPNIIFRLPDLIVVRLRDEFVREIVKPFHPPIVVNRIPSLPEPPPVLRFAPGTTGATIDSGLKATGVESHAEAAAVSSAASLPALDPKTQLQIKALASATSVVDMRQRLVDLHPIIRPFICIWPWLYPFFRTSVDCLRTVPVDENGHFQTTLLYLCVGDKPDLYFKVEQLQGGVWKTIYAPAVACHTYWDYNCGSEVTIVVTDPSAIACVPQDPILTPQPTWVMPYAVGGTLIWGTPSPATPAPNGWVRSDGFTNYSTITDAPFGSLLGFRMGYSNNITGSATIKYFRWSYRKAGTTDWSQMNLPVTRHYVKTVPGIPTPTISFPTIQLGPKSVGAQQNLYDFKPPAPPPPGAGDPAGTTTAWPIDNWFDDIYAAFLDTLGLPGTRDESAGQYQIKLEVFGPTGLILNPITGPFKFIVPSSVDPDGTVHTRLATDAEIEDLGGGNRGGFIFNLQIDNNTCEAAIYATTSGASSVADACGFLRYTPGSNPFTLSFTAKHPNNRAYFSFSVVRGLTSVAAASVNNAEVGLNAGPYTRDANSRFSHGFAQAELLGTCVNAAFAEYLYVAAKVTNGWARLGSGYDASALAAFAVATP